MRSDVNDGTREGRFLMCLLDGRPVADCIAFDTDEGWVKVYVVHPADGDPEHCTQIRDGAPVLLYGAVQPVEMSEWQRLKKSIPVVRVWDAGSVV